MHALTDAWPTDLSWHLLGFDEEGETWCGNSFAAWVEAPSERLEHKARLCSRCRHRATRLMDMCPEELEADYDRYLAKAARR